MCGRYNLRTKLTVLAKQFQFDLDDAFADVKPRYNIAPTQQVLAVRQPEQGAKRELVELRWGLIPVSAKGWRFRAASPADDARHGSGHQMRISKSGQQAVAIFDAPDDDA